MAQFFYVGAQIMCWTFIIQYGTRVFMAEGMEEQAAEVLSQRFNIYAMLFFICSRFIATWLMRWISPARLLTIFGILAMVFTTGVILSHDRTGVYCLVCVSGCMSLMFPTIYGEVRCCRPDHGHPWRFWAASIAGDVHRCWHDQLFVHPALRLLPRRNRLWLPRRHDAQIVLFTVYGLQFTVDNLASHSCCL